MSAIMCKLGSVLLILWIIQFFASGDLYITYRREELLQLAQRAVGQPWRPELDFPVECLRTAERAGLSTHTRRRGARGGLRRRIRARGTKPPLPTVILANVRSLRNKMDDLHASVQYLHEYRDSCLLCFTETWLNPSVDSDTLALPGFGTPIRQDRERGTTGKTIGGGVCLYINSKWCKNHIVRHAVTTPDIELLSVSLRPTYPPREFGQIFVTIVYIHPEADYTKAADKIYKHVQDLEAISPYAQS